MAVLRIRLCETDRDSYGGPEWVVLDTDALLDLPASELEQIEMTIGSALAPYLAFVERADARQARAMLARMRRVCVWLARRQAGLVDEWDKFDPRVLRAGFELVEGADVVPPAEPSPLSSVDGPSDSS